MNSKDQAFVCCGYEYEKDWHWAKIDAVIAKLGRKVPSIHGGVLFFDMTHPEMPSFADDCVEICENYDDYECQRMFRGGMTDEVIFAIAMAKKDYEALHYVQYPIVSFNLPPNIPIPFYGHTRNGLDASTVEKTEKPTVFNHIFFHEGNNMQLLQWYLAFYQGLTGNKVTVQ